MARKQKHLRLDEQTLKSLELLSSEQTGWTESDVLEWLVKEKWRDVMEAQEREREAPQVDKEIEEELRRRGRLGSGKRALLEVVKPQR